MIPKIINTVYYSVIVILIICAFVVLGSEEAKACSDEYEKQFQESIDKECAQTWFKCIENR